MSAARYNETHMDGNSTIGRDQRGMVSFLVTLIMMAVITLIVVGFTEVTNRNSREALDRQLSAQAFYAAESGVNATRDQIQAALTSGAAIVGKTTCANNYDGSSVAPIGPGVKYTCVLVNPNPTTLVYNGINRASSIVIPIETATDLTSLNFSWTKKAGTATGTCTGRADSYYPASPSWTCGFGILRVDLMQVTDPAAPPTDANAMYNYTNTLYLSPFGAGTGNIPILGGGSLPFNTATKGFTGTGCNSAAGSTCGGSGACNTTCTVDFNLSGARKYYARVTMLYRDAGQLTVSAKVASGAAAEFINGQTMVDVTGQAQDELRRIQVRLAPDNSAAGANDGLPLNALTSTNGLCKRFSILPGDAAATPASLCL
jgi:Tfp pilus assembly protein PilX